MRLEHKGLDVSVEFVDNLLTRHVDAWMEAMRKWDPNWRSRPFSETTTQYVLAGLSCHMCNGFKPEELGDMKPAITHWIASEIDRRIAEAIVIPPE